MDDYRRYVLTGAEPARAEAPKPAKKAAAKPTRNEAADLRKRVRQLDGIMAKANEAIGKLDRLLIDASRAANGEQIEKLSRKRAEFERRLVEVEEEWLKTTERLEA